jgi:hypothetical protein
MIHGSCLCGAIAWEVEPPLERMTHCHCSMCRKEHGAAFATYVAGAATTFRWVRGEDLIRRYEAPPALARPFCSRCGSVVAGAPQGGRVFMPAGNLDDDPVARPVVHIFTGSKACWHEIHDGVAQHEEHAPGRESPAVADLVRPAPIRAGALRGSCLCGRAAYEVSGEISGIVKCHCSRCRKARSAAHGANLFFKNPDFRWVQGQDHVEGFKVPDAHRFMNHFCRTCGGILPRREPDPGFVGIPAGSLDRVSESHDGVEEKVHIYVGSKAPWYEIHDSLPQIDESPPTT